MDCSSLGSSGVGLTVGASNITINLGGYEIIGPATATTCPATEGSTDSTKGILVEGFDNVNILNGAITGFLRGIRVKNAAGVNITNIEAYNNAFSAVRVRDGVPDLVVNRAYFHDNLDDHMGVSGGSHVTVMNSQLVDGCASGIFVNPGGNSADLKNNYIARNHRSAITYWGASGSAENNFIEGNNSDTEFSSSSDFGQISLINLDGSEILIRCNVIRDSSDVQGNIERAVGFRDSLTASTVEITKNLFVNNPVGIWFSEEGVNVGVDIHKNTFDTNTTDFELVASPIAANWTVDASKNFFAASSPVVSDNGSGNTVTVSPSLKSAQHCRAAQYSDGS